MIRKRRESEPVYEESRFRYKWLARSHLSAYVGTRLLLLFELLTVLLRFPLLGLNRSLFTMLAKIQQVNSYRMTVRIFDDHIHIGYGLLGYAGYWKQIPLDRILGQCIVTRNSYDKLGLMENGVWGQLTNIDAGVFIAFRADCEAGVLLDTENHLFLIESAAPERLADAIWRARDRRSLADHHAGDKCRS